MFAQGRGRPGEIARAATTTRGADELTFLDITASSDQRDTIYDIVARVADEVFIPLTVGGGVRSVEDVRKLMNAGADKASINTAAVKTPELVEGGGRPVRLASHRVAIDARRKRERRGLGGVHARRPQRDGLDAVEWAVNMTEFGAGEILLTSMDRDGTKSGFDQH